VSGLHAELSFRNGYWHIRDKGSTNGIKVNGTRVPEKYLHPGDEITIAKRHFKIEYQLLAGRHTLEELEEEEDIMGQSLLEKAGLSKPRRDRDERPRNFDPGEFLLVGRRRRAEALMFAALASRLISKQMLRRHHEDHVISDQQNGRIHEKMADPRGVNGSGAVIEPGPHRSPGSHAKRKRYGRQPKTVR
jgi:hypothetical protein